MSRAIGVMIVLMLLVAFMVSTFVGIVLNTTITLAFLGVATSLIGVPFGWELVRRNGSSSR
jgi:hypothetical protein